MICEKKNLSVAVAQLEDAILDLFEVQLCSWADVKTTEKFKTRFLYISVAHDYH